MQQALFYSSVSQVQPSQAGVQVGAAAVPFVIVQAPSSGWRELRGCQVVTKDGTALVTRYRAQFAYVSNSTKYLPNPQDPCNAACLDSQDSGFFLELDSSLTVQATIFKADGSDFAAGDLVNVYFYHNPIGC